MVNLMDRGRLIYADGREYMGEFKDDTFNEQGELTLTDGKKYIGEFKDGERYGI